MTADIITIGDELLIGQVVDTNSSWIARQLNLAGISIRCRTAVGDKAEQITEALDTAIVHSDIVIITGGLGPTRDDLTKQTLARWLGVELVFDRATFDRVERLLTSRGIDPGGINRSQAMLPEGCRILPNDLGTAPGMWMEREGRVIISLPGVPFEMKGLMEGQVLGMLRERFPTESIIHRTALCFGLAESTLAERIESWEDALPHWLRLAYLPNPSGVRLRLSAYGVDPLLAGREIDERFERLRQLVPDYFVGFYDSVNQAVADLLTASGHTLAVAESCTGGAISASLTAMAGASAYLLGSVVSYSNELKQSVLAVDAGDLERYGAVSRQVAEQMAVGVRRLCNSDYALATTGIAGPGGGTPLKPVGTVWIAVATPSELFSHMIRLGDLREQNIARASASAVNMLRLLLIGRPEVATSDGLL
ncbi:CinA-like protein [Bacteroidia bacterium]|nr:CinA-like protein [Bacteroidia bacterium]